jgi:hypothetical protein
MVATLLLWKFKLFAQSEEPVGFEVANIRWPLILMTYTERWEPSKYQTLSTGVVVWNQSRKDDGVRLIFILPVVVHI